MPALLCGRAVVRSRLPRGARGSSTAGLARVPQQLAVEVVRAGHLLDVHQRDPDLAVDGPEGAGNAAHPHLGRPLALANLPQGAPADGPAPRVVPPWNPLLAPRHALQLEPVREHALHRLLLEDAHAGLRAATEVLQGADEASVVSQRRNGPADAARR